MYDMALLYQEPGEGINLGSKVKRWSEAPPSFGSQGHSHVDRLRLLLFTFVYIAPTLNFGQCIDGHSASDYPDLISEMSQIFNYFQKNLTI